MEPLPPHALLNVPIVGHSYYKVVPLHAFKSEFHDAMYRKASEALKQQNKKTTYVVRSTW